MCILCVIQKWSRRVANMLPWLVIPLVGLWALSQLLPPAFRFEITSPRLACVFVLLVTLFWYEVLVPQLSSWRVRRNARLREMRRVEAIELQKLRKTATRRCRNCLNPYRDQNPGGGRFMCSYCGHISKRPVLDLPVPSGLGMSNSGIIKDLFIKGGKMLNTKTWSDNGLMCSQDWLENGNWVGGSFSSKSNYWPKNGTGIFGGDEYCMAEKSYSGILKLACKLLTSFFLSIRWLWTKVFRESSSEDVSGDVNRRGLAKRGENGLNFHESRCERARRKAEEKRQARLEKESLEEEERKQREEVARLVKERRKLRDEKIEADSRNNRSLPINEKVCKKEAEKKHQEMRIEKDNVSSKSNSDAEDMERKAGKESEPKRDGNKNTEIDLREHKKTETEILKGQGMEIGSGMRNISSRGNGGTRYLDRMRGTFFSPSKAFGGSKAVTAATVTKENKSNNCVEHIHTASDKTDLCPPERVAEQSSINSDHNINCSVLTEQQSRAAPKKSWQQLFTRSASDPTSSNTNVISRPSAKLQAEVQNPPLCLPSLTQLSDNSIAFGMPMPLTTTKPNGPISSSLGFSPPVESKFPVGEGPSEFVPEELDRFEDPCYVPDPISLLGPVSESLDKFHMDLGSGFITERGLERNPCLKNVSAFSEGTRPSPIEPPLSRSRVERPSCFNRFPHTLEVQDTHSLTVEDADANNKGTWQMWNTSPLGHDGLGLIGGLASLTLPPERKGLTRENFVYPSSQETMTSLFTQEDHVFPGTHYPEKVFLSSAQNGGTFCPVTSLSDHDPWLQNPFFPAMSGSENDHSLKPQEDEMIYGSANRSAINQPFDQSPANYWSKKEWDAQGSGEGNGKSAVFRPHITGLFPTSDVHSLWQYNK